jgi:AcrR family transcriptional regulator
MTDTGVRRRLSRDQRREQLLESAATILRERGATAVTMESVAAVAGVSKATPYLHFANSDELLLSLLDSERSILEARIAERLRAGAGYEESLRVWVGAWFDIVAERGDLLGPLLQAGHVMEAMRANRDTYYRDQEAVYGELLYAEFGIPRKVGAAGAAALLPGLGGVLDRWVSTGEPRDVLEETYIRVVLAAVEALSADAATAKAPRTPRRRRRS